MDKSVSQMDITALNVIFYDILGSYVHLRKFQQTSF